MSTTGAARGNNRRNRAAKSSATVKVESAAAKNAPNTEASEATVTDSSNDHAAQQEEVMAEQAKNSDNGGTPQEAVDKKGKLDLAEKPKDSANGSTESGLALRREAHQGKGEMQVAESFSAAGLRPIAADTLEVFGTILNDRPIEASHLRVVEYAFPGHRPIFASDIVVREDISLPGGRPIIASPSNLLNAPLLIGGRPIASNEIDDSASLMGYID